MPPGPAAAPVGGCDGSPFTGDEDEDEKHSETYPRSHWEKIVRALPRLDWLQSPGVYLGELTAGHRHPGGM